MGTVLIVDTSFAVREAVTTVLELEHYRVLAVGSGAEALAAVATERPDLVLLDLSLPDMSATDLRGELRSRGVTAPVVFMWLCACAMQQAVVDGSEDILEKPFDAQTLLTVIARNLPSCRKAA